MSAIYFESDVVHYEVLGRGKPVLFLHGWVGSWRYWIPIMQTVSMNYRSYALDLWGFGDTAKCETKYSIKEQMNLVYLFQKQMGLDKVAIIGHGLGAVTGLLYGLNFPDFVDRIMLVSYPLTADHINGRLHQNSPLELSDWLLGNSRVNESARMDVPKTDPLAIRTSIKDINRLNLAGLVNQLQIKSLLVHGLRDGAVNPPKNEDLGSLSEDEHLLFFEQCSHFLMLEESSKFNRLLVEFLNLSSGDNVNQLQLKDEWKRRVR